MKQFVQFIGLVLLTSFILIACKKSNSSDPKAITVANLSATYQLTDLKATYLGISVDVYDTLPACEKDNLVRLDASGTAALLDAGVVCNPPDTASGTWSLNTMTDSLTVVGLGSNHVESFDGKVLVLKGLQDYSGTSITTTTTLTKQ